MRRTRNVQRWVGLLLALTLLVFGAVACSTQDDSKTDNTCPTQEQITDAADRATDLRKEAEGQDGGKGREARDKASDAEAETEGLQARYDSDECVAEREAAETTTTEAEETTTTTSEPEVMGDIVVEVDTSTFPDHFPEGVASDELAFGSDAAAAMEDAPEERGDAAHSGETLRTPEQLTSWLKSDDPKAKPVHDRVVMMITAVCGVEDVSVHLDDSQGWLLMAILPESQVQGLSYFVDNHMVFADSWRQTQGRDGYWLPVCTQGANEGTIVWDGFVRADCGNGADKPVFRIVREGTPSAPPVDAPPEPKCPSHQPYGYWDGKQWVCKEGPDGSSNAQGNNNSAGTGPEEGGSVEGGPHGPATTPGDTYTAPEAPAAEPTPETRPGGTTTTAPTAPPTTAPSNTDPEVTAPDVTGDPGPDGF